MSNTVSEAKLFSSHKSAFFWTSLLIVGLLILAPRLWKLGQFVTVDEPRWITRSANFLMAARLGNWEETYQKEHPGVTIMWAGAFGHVLEGYSVLFGHAGGFIDQNELEKFLKLEGESVLNRLVAGRAVLVVIITMLSLLAYTYAGRLMGWGAAFLGFVLIALEPFLIAHQRLLHLDGLLCVLALLALLSGANYLFGERRRVDLVVSGAATGFAFLTKSPGIIMLPVFALLGLAWIVIGRRESSLAKRIRRISTDGIAWLVVALLIWFAFWPAAWVDPLGTMVKVFQGAAGYAEAGHDSALFFGEHIYTDASLPWYFYPVTYMWRSTPFVLLGLLFACMWLFLDWKNGAQPGYRRNIFVLLCFVVVYASAMALGKKQFDRYLLPIYSPLALVAGLGYERLIRQVLFSWQKARKRNFTNWRRTWVALGLVFLVFFGFQVFAVIRISPYTMAYYNPILRAIWPVEDMMMVGWGEGLDEAARILNEQDGAEKLRALSWYPDGAFSYYFLGETERSDMPVDVHQLPNVHYLVIYIHQFQRELPSQDFLDYFRVREPYKVVEINGIRYAEIYRIPDSAYNENNEFIGWAP